MIAPTKDYKVQRSEEERNWDYDAILLQSITRNAGCVRKVFVFEESKTT